MTRFKLTLLAVGLCLIGGASGMVARLRSAQELGQPGVRVAALPGTNRAEILFPETVQGKPLIPLEASEGELAALPADTSFGRRGFDAEDGFTCVLSVVLMGADRTSIHRPQYCLTGQGWRLNAAEAMYDVIPVGEPQPYDLPVRKLVGSKEVRTDAGAQTFRAVFVYWFVAEDRMTNRDGERMWWMASEMLTSGKLQRWAYIACYSFCRPGEEDATYQRIREFVAEAIPRIQTTAGGKASD